MNTREEYVTCTQAQALKELGFDWTCRYYATKGYAHDEHYWKSPCLGDLRNSDLKSIWFTIPTQAVACRWLREEKGLWFDLGVSASVQYTIDVFSLDKEEYFICEGHFSSYEAAISAGIDRALKLLKGGEK